MKLLISLIQATLLKANGLEVRDEIADISARLIVNKAAMKTKFSSIQSIVDAIGQAVEL